MTNPRLTFVRNCAVSMSSNAEPFSIQPPAKIGPPRKSGRRPIAAQVAGA